MRKFKLASIALLLVLSLCVSSVYASGITIDGLKTSLINKASSQRK